MSIPDTRFDNNVITDLPPSVRKLGTAVGQLWTSEGRKFHSLRCVAFRPFVGSVPC